MISVVFHTAGINEKKKIERKKKKKKKLSCAEPGRATA